MPILLIAAQAAFWSAGVALGLGATAITMIGYALVGLAAIGVYNYQKRKMRDAYNASLKDRLVMAATADGPRRRIYGRVRVSGEVIFKATSGDKSQFYTLVVALAGHEVDAIEGVYINDTPVSIVTNAVSTEPWGDRLERTNITETFVASGTSMTVTFGGVSESASVTYAGADGKRLGATVTAQSSSSITFNTTPGVTYTVDWVRIRQSSFCIVKKYTGSPAQDLSSAVRYPASGVDNGIITSSDKFSGIACLVVLMSYDPTAFPGGIPTFSAVVKGARIYDPRTGLTQWSENPALCARDAALHPNIGGLVEDDLDLASFTAAANVCDTSVTYTVNGADETRPLYTCGYMAKYDQSAEQHIGELVEAMGGKHAWSAGRLKVRAGAYTSPVAAINDAWLAGSVSVTRGVSESELVNIYRPTIADSAQGYMALPIAELRIGSYITEDGQELPQEVALSAVTYAPQALHICGIMARDMRDGLTVRLACNMRAFALELFDVVTLTIARYGWSAKTFEVLGREFTQNGQIILTLKETRALIYEQDADFVVDDPSDNTMLPLPWNIQAISGLTADSGESHLLIQADGSILTRVKVTYSSINDESVLNGGHIDVSWSVSGSGVWSTVTVDGSDPSVYLPGLNDGELYLIRARTRSQIVASVWSAVVAHRVIGKSAPPPTPDAFNVRVMPDGTRVLEGGYTTTAKPVDFAGWRIKYRQGTGPYDFSDLLPFHTDSNGLIQSMPFETNQLTAGTWTLALVAVDTSGIESEPLMIVGILPNPRLGDALLYFSLEAIGWPGTLTDGVRDTYEGQPIISAAEQSTWADLTTWDAWTRWAYDPVTTWTYQLDDEDLGAVVSTLPVVDIDGVGVIVTEEQHSSDGSTWTSWAAIAGSFVARYVRIRVTVAASGATGPGVTQYTYLSSMRVVYTASVSQEVIEDLDPSALTGSYRIGTGDIRLPITGSYATIRVESIVIQSGSAGTWTWQLVDKDTTVGPRVKIFNSGVLADPPLIDATVKGITT